MNHAERLRSVCADIRRKPYPISDVVPVMQAAADAIDAIQSALDDAIRMRDEFMGLLAALSQDDGKAERAIAELEAKLAARGWRRSCT